MLSLELKRILFRSPILFACLFVVPLYILTFFVPGTTEPTEVPENINAAIVAAEKKLDDLPSSFDDYSNFGEYKAQLLDAWVLFGGITDDLNEYGDSDRHGMYYFFYHAEVNMPQNMFDTFEDAKKVFMNGPTSFYSLYQEFFALHPMLLIDSSDYEKFTEGVQGLYDLFKVDYSTAVQLNEARYQMTQIRMNVHFRSIISNMETIALTREQSNDLKTKYSDIHQIRNQMPQSNYDDCLRYIDFCEMAYEYLTYYMNLYIAESTDFNIGKYFGFGNIHTDSKKAEIARIEYLMKNGETNMDYSKPFSFLSVLHEPTGTTVFDYTFNALEIITIALALLAILITIFCIHTDIKNKTVIGSLISPNSRHKIISTKLMACHISIFLVLALFCALFFFTATAMVGTVTAPTVLVVLLGSQIIKLSPLILFLVYLAILVIKLILVISITALLCMVLKNKFALAVISGLIAIGIILIDFFLRNLVIYQIIILPAFIIAAILLLFETTRRFRRKDF